MKKKSFRILVLDKFHKSVPKDKQEHVKEKVKMLARELEKHNCQFERVSNGFDLRKVEEVAQPIYKFRLNQGDRILCARGDELYPHIRQEYEKSLVLLEYCTHDKQIRTAKNRDFTKQGVHELHEETVVVEDEENNLLDFSLSHSSPNVQIVSREKIDDIFGEEGRFYYLDDVQNVCAQLKKNGELVMGSAGSGKTTIGVYKLANYITEHRDEDFRLCYVTFSKRLKEKTEKLFQDIAMQLYGLKPQEFESKVEFFTLEEHLEQLHEDQYNLITYDTFKDWCAQKNIKFDALSLWKERRGIFQGIIGANWQYEINVSVSTFNRTVIHMLQNRGYIDLDASHQSFRLCEDINEICQFLEHNGQSAVEFRNHVIRQYNSVISAKKELDEEEYDRLSSKGYTNFTKEEKDKVKSIFKKYKDFMKSVEKQGFREEGDLVRMALEESNPQYDYMVIDEIQDLTEVQVYYLCQLIKKKTNVFACGDFHQTINPTFFHAGRIEGIFKFLGGMENFEELTLKKNYRSSRSIVELANEIADLRRTSIKGSASAEYKETAVREYTKQPYLFKGEKDQLLRQLIDKSYVLIVVPHEQSKQELIQRIPQLESNVLTVAEAKGIESKYVVTYNMISAFKEQWQEIMKRNKLHPAVHRYYFNVLYVAVTRARDVIGMIEDDLCEEMEEWLSMYVETIHEFDIRALELRESSTLDDLLEKAKEYEADERFSNAIAAYRNILEKKDAFFMEEAKRGIERCNIKQACKKDREHAKWGAALLELKEYAEAIPYLKKGKDGQKLLQAILLADVSGLDKEMEKLGTTSVRVLTELDDVKLMEKFLQYKIQPFEAHFGKVIEQTTNLRNVFVAK